MTKFFAGVLSVIAVGVMLIAYGLLTSQAASLSDNAQFVRPMLANERGLLMESAYGASGAPVYFYADRHVQPAPYGSTPYPTAPVAVRTAAQPVPAAVVTQASRENTRVVERAPERSWKKRALVIGGSTATGAGVGAIFGDKKGALIGAAIGGGASSIYESTR